MGHITGASGEASFVPPPVYVQLSPQLVNRPPGQAPALPDLSHVPPEYSDLPEVFSNHRASALPPHQAYNCVIDVLPG